MSNKIYANPNINSKGKKEDSVAKRVRRTGEKTFVVEHDDGSKFECKTNNPEYIKIAEAARAKGSGLLFSGIGKSKPLICDSCNNRVYRVSISNGKSLCHNCK